MSAARGRRRSGGFTLIEILVTIVIVVFGLLGLVGLQAKASNVEFESYQRGQALSLLRDMKSRLAASRALVTDGYLKDDISSTDGSAYVGSGEDAKSFADADGDCVAPGGDILKAAKFETCQWAQLLLGAAEKSGGSNVGAMVGARGCLIRIDPPQAGALADLYVVVVWQGIVAGAEPPAGSPAGQCASGVDYGAGLRRGMSLRVLVPNLTKTV